jgi:sugar O-acyltransferase (sialic acid O-acetyltransferase NeuD family)
LGGGEHSRVVVEAALSDPRAWTVLGITDPGPAARTRELLGVSHLGDDEAILARVDQMEPEVQPWFILGFVGTKDPAERRRVIARIGPDRRWATIVHGSAWVSPSASLGPGSVVLAGAIVNAGARIGRHVVVNTRAVLEHDVVVGDLVHVGPGVVVGGGARLGDSVTVGLGALVRDHVEIGVGATVGMGSVVVADVPPSTVVVGSPARPM